MANLFENKDRRVIPNWRAFEKTVFLGELDFHESSHDIIPALDIENYIQDWLGNKSVIHAAELISAGLVNDQKRDIHVLDAAEFILKNPTRSSVSQISLSKKLLQREDVNILKEEASLLGDDNPANNIQITLIRAKIHELRTALKTYSNAISYVELARCYSIIGLKDKAAEAMKIALHLAKNNRFVLRSATRLFLHNGEVQLAHDILKRNALTTKDPWLMSAEISVSLIQKRTSKLLKNGIDLIQSKNISPFNFTELASSVGTVEMIEGNNKKSRQFFEMALIKPNDNSLAQIEWASHKNGQTNFNPDTLTGVSLNYEALAFRNYYAKQFTDSLSSAVKWFNDMPYTKKPIMFASHLASSIMKDHSTAISLVKAGLISHPGDASLINNLAYSLALNGQPEDAQKWLNRIRKDAEIDEATKICLLATRGLIKFRQGKPEEGRLLYYEAFEKTRGLKSSSLNCKAILNVAREEIRIGSEHIESIMGLVAKIPDDIEDISIEIVRNDVMSDYEKYKTK